jgi:hypothetical protein
MSENINAATDKRRYTSPTMSNIITGSGALVTVSAVRAVDATATRAAEKTGAIMEEIMV